MEIKSVAVLGAGAVGSYVIWGLSEKSGRQNNFSVLNVLSVSLQIR